MSPELANGECFDTNLSPIRHLSELVAMYQIVPPLDRELEQVMVVDGGRRARDLRSKNQPMLSGHILPYTVSVLVERRREILARSHTMPSR